MKNYKILFVFGIFIVSLYSPKNVSADATGTFNDKTDAGIFDCDPYRRPCPEGYACLKVFGRGQEPSKCIRKGPNYSFCTNKPSSMDFGYGTPCKGNEKCIYEKYSKPGVRETGRCIAPSLDGGNTCKENEELKDGICECKKGYYFAGGKCVSKDDARKICKARENTAFDEVVVHCICKDGYAMDQETKKCVQIEPTAECKAAESALGKVEDIIQNIRNEITKVNNISNKRRKNRDKEFPEEAWKAKFDSYEDERDNLKRNLKEIETVRLKTVKEHIKANECSTAKDLAELAQATLEKVGYARFRARSCAMQSTPVVKKMGAHLISAFLTLPEGCDPTWIRLKVKKRTWQFYGPFPVRTTTYLTTNNGKDNLVVSRVEYQDAIGASGEIRVDQLLHDVVIRENYGKGGLMFINWSSTWIYGEVQVNPDL